MDWLAFSLALCGLPDILTTQFGGGAHTVFINQGESNAVSNRVIRWAAGAEVAGDQRAWNVNLQSATEIAHLADMNGDGLADLVFKSPINDVYAFANGGNSKWSARQTMSIQDSPPPLPFKVWVIPSSRRSIPERPNAASQ